MGRNARTEWIGVYKSLNESFNNIQTMELRHIMQNTAYTAVNDVENLSGNKYDILEHSKIYVPES